jgi:C-3',4' desaturase CrtD
MDYEVVVVGGGVGGLTTAALLAARGLKVCLCERQSRPGGCVANFEHFGYTFEPTAGLYSGWQPEGVYEKIFSELRVTQPELYRLSPAYVVRLPDKSEISICEDSREFEDNLRTAFPECGEAAVSFYSKLTQVAQAWSDAEDRAAASSSKPRPQHDASAIYRFPPSLADWANTATTQHLADTSPRFKRFIDVQLQTFAQCASDECSYLSAASVLATWQRGMWAIRGGAQALADALAQSLRESGGELRLNSPVLRLAYGSDNCPVGVDLLSGERINATRAIVSNLTVWDTYGKLIGLGRTPVSISARLKQLRAWGAYLLFLALDESAASRLTSNRILALIDWQRTQPYAPDEAQLMFTAAPASDPRAPAGKRAVTVSTFTNAEEWFAFHENDSAPERQDQAALETWWVRLHSALPELGDSVEVIETATPRTFYEITRRKLGLVGGLCAGRLDFPPPEPFGATIFPNVFLVGDTACFGFGLEAVCKSALALAHTISRG